MNDVLYEAVKVSLIDDVGVIYEEFKYDNKDLEGVIIQLNSSRGLGEYLKDNPKKITDLMESLYGSLNFSIKLVLSRDGEERYYPLIEN